MPNCVAPGAALDRFGRLIELRRRQCLDLGRWWAQMQALPADDAARQRLVSAVRGEMSPLCDSAEALEDLKIARDYIRMLQGGQGNAH